MIPLFHEESFKKRSAESAVTKTESADGAQERHVSEKIEKRIGQGVFTDLIVGPESVAKSAAMRVFTPDGEGQIDSVEAALARWAGQSTDATVAPEYPASSFPGLPGSIVDRLVRAGDGSVTPPQGYIYEEPDANSAGTLTPQFLNVDEGGGLKEPANYSPTQPKDRTAVDAVVPPDYDHDDDVSPWQAVDTERPDNDDDDKPVGKAVRMGNGYVLKSSFGRKR